MTVSESTLAFGEGGSATYTVVLDSQPTADVTIGVAFAPGTDADLTVDQATLTFTAADWRDAQTVEVRAAEDADDVHDVTTVQHTVSGGDYGANSVAAADVSVEVTDNECGVDHGGAGGAAGGGGRGRGRRRPGGDRDRDAERRAPRDRHRGNGIGRSGDRYRRGLCVGGGLHADDRRAGDERNRHRSR